MAYVVAVLGTEDEKFAHPALIGPFDTGLEAGEFACRLPALWQWNTLYLNAPDSDVARFYLQADGSEPDDELEGD
jgi:hypothetical protein